MTRDELEMRSLQDIDMLSSSPARSYSVVSYGEQPPTWYMGSDGKPVVMVANTPWDGTIPYALTADQIEDARQLRIARESAEAEYDEFISCGVPT